MENYVCLNDVILRLPTNAALTDAPKLLAAQGISRESIALVSKAIVNMPPGSDYADLSLELRSDAVLGYEPPAEESRIVVLTIHAAKGREWDWVFVAALDEDVLPIGNTNDLEEERRLLFVAITRARERLVLSTANLRRAHKWQRQPQPALPSRFFKEMEFVK